MEIKSPYLTSVAENSNLTNKFETDGALIYPPAPSLHLCSIKRVFKATSTYTETKKVERRICGNTWESNTH